MQKEKNRKKNFGGWPESAVIRLPPIVNFEKSDKKSFQKNICISPKTSAE